MNRKVFKPIGSIVYSWMVGKMVKVTIFYDDGRQGGMKQGESLPDKNGFARLKTEEGELIEIPISRIFRRVHDGHS